MMFWIVGAFLEIVGGFGPTESASLSKAKAILESCPRWLTLFLESSQC
ncbi:hypothetical protein [Ureibacillus terrenus]|nr:hypothetical protein [Ureibacillus terrenus]MED3662275.1 hypothetical protein [Ureibacillus terrenus]MED3764577.1 hypothetical protein [Ureibacillus terrenus]